MCIQYTWIWMKFLGSGIFLSYFFLRLFARARIACVRVCVAIKFNLVAEFFAFIRFTRFRRTSLPFDLLSTFYSKDEWIVLLCACHPIFVTQPQTDEDGKLCSLKRNEIRNWSWTIFFFRESKYDKDEIMSKTFDFLHFNKYFCVCRCCHV